MKISLVLPFFNDKLIIFLSFLMASVAFARKNTFSLI